MCVTQGVVKNRYFTTTRVTHHASLGRAAHNIITVNFAYNDTRRSIKKVSIFAKCRYTRSLIICITVGRDFVLGMKMLPLFANCRYIRSRY